MSFSAAMTASALEASATARLALASASSARASTTARAARRASISGDGALFMALAVEPLWRKNYSNGDAIWVLSP